MRAAPGTGRLPTARAPSSAPATLVVLALALTACHRGPPRPAPPAIEASSARIVAEEDSVAVRRALSRSITRFQDVWRAGWKAGEVARHGALAFHFVQPDLEAGYYSPDVRRYLAIYCNAGWQGLLVQGQPAANPANEGLPTQPGRMSVAQLDAFRARAQLPPQLRTQAMGRVRGDRDRGTICPMWTPAEDDLPLDEADNPDLALLVAMRPRLKRERDSLLARLEVAAERFPGDGWITGQRVRFHLDQQEPAKALAAADRCAAQASWCQSLRGVALERLARFDEAELAFRGAQRSVLGENAPGENVSGQNAPAASVLDGNDATCGDPYLLRIVDDRTRRSLSELDCRARHAALDTLWWLSDPLWSDAGNDRYVAHHARQIWTSVRAGVERDERFSWREASGGDAMREVIVRYGWPSHTYWGGRFLDDSISLNREAARRIPDPPYPALEYSPERATFIPTWDVLSEPFDADASAWTIERPADISLDAWWPDEHMRRFPAVRPMPAGQQAILRRDTTVLTALAIDNPAPDQAVDAIEAPVAALVAGFGPGNTRVLERAPVSPGTTLRIAGHAPLQPFVLSVELESRVPHEPARRLRTGVRPPPVLTEGEVALSEPLLLHARGTDDTGALSTVEALALMRGSLDVERSAPVGLYWETYALALADTVDIAVEIVRDDRAGLLRRAGEALGLASGLRDSVSVRWREPAAERNVTIVPGRITTIGRAIELDMRNVAPGAYVIRLTVSGSGGRTARSERRFRIID